MQSDKSKFKDEFERRVYIFALNTISLREQLQKDQVIKDIGGQLLRSATSIGANVIEAQASSSKKDYTNFFTHALKSANETKFCLSLLKDSGKADEIGANQLLQEATEIPSILATSVLTLKGER